MSSVGTVDHPSSGKEAAKPGPDPETSGTNENPEKVEPVSDEKPKAKKAAATETKPAGDG